MQSAKRHQNCLINCAVAIATCTLPPPPLVETPPPSMIRVPRIPVTSGVYRSESSEMGLSNGSPEKRASPLKQQQHQMLSPAASTSCTSLDHQADTPMHLSLELANSTSSLETSIILNDSSADLSPLKLHSMVSPTVTTTGTQYQIEKEPKSYSSPVSTSPTAEDMCSGTPATTPRTESKSLERLFSPTPEPRSYHSEAALTTTLRAQEQALPVHKGDFQSPFPNGDELVPEPLADTVKMEAGPLLSMIDLFQVECLYSKHWQLREKALQFLIDKVEANKLNDEPLPSFRYTFENALM